MEKLRTLIRDMRNPHYYPSVVLDEALKKMQKEKEIMTFIPPGSLSELHLASDFSFIVVPNNYGETQESIYLLPVPDEFEEHEFIERLTRKECMVVYVNGNDNPETVREKVLKLLKQPAPA